MTKEELREGIEHLLATFTGEGDFTTELLDYLDSVGVVRKVDREPKHPWRDDCMSAHSETCKTCDNCEILEFAQFDLIEAGYVAVESLIKEE